MVPYLDRGKASQEILSCELMPWEKEILIAGETSILKSNEQLGQHSCISLEHRRRMYQS